MYCGQVIFRISLLTNIIVIGRIMDVMLILNNNNEKILRVTGKVTDNQLIKKVSILLLRNKKKEAFDILIKNVEPENIYPEDIQIPRKSMYVILDEKLINAEFSVL